MKRWLMAGLITCLMMSFTLQQGAAAKGANDGKKETLKALYSSKDVFMELYGNAFKKKFPNIDIQVIPIPKEPLPTGDDPASIKPEDPKEKLVKLKNLIDKEKPDLIPVDTENLEFLVNEKLVQDLTPYIEKSKFDLKKLHAPIVDLIKAKGNGKMYSLAPSFYTHVLFYNKDLFQKHGVSLPKDQMSWQDVFNLAGRFPAKVTAKIDGFSDPFKAVERIGQSEGLSYYNKSSNKIAFNTPQWKKAIQLVLNANQKEAIKLHNSDAPELDSDPIFEGEAAMFTYPISMMELFKKMKVPYKWDVVSYPVGSSGLGYKLNAEYMFAINKQSNTQDAAWKFIEFVNSEEWVKYAFSKSIDIGAPTRSEYAKYSPNNKYNLKTVYTVKKFPVDSVSLPSWDYVSKVQDIFNQEIRNVLNKHKSLDDALKSIDEQGNAALGK